MAVRTHLSPGQQDTPHCHATAAGRKEKILLSSPPLYGPGEGLDIARARQQSRQNPIVSRASVPEVQSGIALENATMKTSEVDLDQGILVKHSPPASEPLTD